MVLDKLKIHVEKEMGLDHFLTLYPKHKNKARWIIDER